jgi:uncharacterized integral membrane protein (TIGR00698 family)
MRTHGFVVGLLLLAVVGVAGWLLGGVTPVPGLVAAVAVGALVGNSVGYPDRLGAGVGTHKLWLETGIVLMGAGIALGAVVEAGPTVLGLVVATVVGTLLFVELLARGVLSVPAKLTSLLAAGASVCGVSAVVSVAGSIDADESHVAYASATVLAFDALTLVAYPPIGQFLGLSDVGFGVWAGTTMFSTGPVTAAGFAVSPTAGRWAVLVKLTRNALIGVVTVAYAMYYARRRRTANDAAPADASGGPGLTGVLSNAPRFLVGFLLLAVLGNTVLSAGAVDMLETASNWLFLLAFAGLGLELRLDDLRSAGLTPMAVLAASLVTFSAAMLVVVEMLF